MDIIIFAKFLLISLYKTNVWWTRFPTCEIPSFSKENQLFRKSKTRSPNIVFVNKNGEEIRDFYKTSPHFCLYSHGLLNAFSSLQNVEFSVIPSHISDFRKSRSIEWAPSDPIASPNVKINVWRGRWVAGGPLDWTRFPGVGNVRRYQGKLNILHRGKRVQQTLWI